MNAQVSEIDITAGKATLDSKQYRKTSKSGFMSSSKTERRSTAYDETAIVSTISGETVLLQAGGVGQGNIAVEGSNVVSTNGTTLQADGDIAITSAENTSKQVTETKYKQSGLSLSISNPVINAIQTVNQMKQAASNTSDSRMQALAAGTAALSGKNAYDAVKSGMANSGANVAQQAGGVNISLSIGTSKSSSTSTQTTTTAQGSQVAAGKNVNIMAKGAGEQSDITVIGSQIKSGENATLKADDQVNLLAAQNTDTLNSKNKGSNASIGIGFSMGGSQNGFSLELGASQSKGKANGQDITWTETQVEAGNKVTLQSGTDTNIIGAQVRGKQVIADIGTSGKGDLNVQSLQDTSTYKSKQSSAGVNVSICVPPFCVGTSGGSMSASNSKINSDYASVNEQAGIYAGDGGFQITTNGNTNLQGAVIASTDKAIQDNKNSLTTNTLITSNIENKVEYDAKAIAASIGVGSQTGKPTLSGAGYGKDSGDATSKTVSAVSGGDVTIKDNASQQSQSGKDATTTLVLLNRDVHVDDKGNAVDSQGNSTTAKVSPIFDADKVAKEIQAQVQITQAFSQQAYQAVGTYVQERRQNLQNQLKAATTAEEKAAIQAQLKELRIEEQVMNVLIGAVAGTGGTALAKESLSAAAEEMRRITIESSQKFVGAVDAYGNTLDNLLDGKSEGVRGDGIGTGGTRVDLDLLCGAMNQRCARQQDANGNDILDQNGIPKLALNEKGQVVFTAKNADESPMSFDYFIANTPEGQKMPGDTGGIQGYIGTLFGTAYKAGSWQDKLIESFGGTHDFIGGQITGLYDEQGNATRGRSDALIKAHNTWSATGAIVASTPFAMSELLPPEVWQAISILLRNAK